MTDPLNALIEESGRLSQRLADIGMKADTALAVFTRPDDAPSLRKWLHEIAELAGSQDTAP